MGFSSLIAAMLVRIEFTTLLYLDRNNRTMSLGYVLEQRKMEFTVTASFIALAISTFIILAAMPVQQPVNPPGMNPPGTLLANVFAANSEASASSTIYSFAFTATTSS